MERTVRVGAEKIRLSNNIGWTLIYRDQFGSDILPAIMPLFWSVADLIGGLFDELELDGRKKVSVEEAVRALSSEAVSDAFVKLSGLEFADFVRITWALAKAADDSIEEPREWVKKFDEFPIDVIGPAVFELVAKGMISSKNLSRLREILQSMMPKPKDETQESESTPSSSQE